MGNKKSVLIDEKYTLFINAYNREHGYFRFILHHLHQRHLTDDIAAIIKRYYADKIYPQFDEHFNGEAEPIKLVVVGDGAVGKTTLLCSYAHGGCLPDCFYPSVFDTYMLKKCIGPQCVHFSPWDTAGQEDYDRLRPLSYPQTHVFLLCFSIISASSAANVKQKWIKELRDVDKAEQYGYSPNIPIVLCGLKTDARDWRNGHGYEYERVKDQIMNRAFGEQLAKEIGAEAYVEGSSKRYTGMDAIFQTAVIVGMKYKFVDSLKNPNSKRKRKK